jgi:hypothetical protein
MSDLLKYAMSHKNTLPTPSKYMTNTARYRLAFTALGSGQLSMRAASVHFSIARKKLRHHYDLFLASRLAICEFEFVIQKRGRKSLLSEEGLSALKIAAHTLDHIGHPVSTTSLNKIITSLHEKETKKIKLKPLPSSTLSNWRRKTKIPKQSVRNGPSSRESKSTAYYIEGFYFLLVEIITKYSIKKENMFVLSLHF